MQKNSNKNFRKKKPINIGTKHTDKYSTSGGHQQGSHHEKEEVQRPPP